METKSKRVTVHVPCQNERVALTAATDAYRMAFGKLGRVTIAVQATPWLPVNGKTSGWLVEVVEFKIGGK